MNTNTKVKLIGTILGIIFFIALIAGVSYAWITWDSSNTGISGITECMKVNYTNGGNIDNANVLLFDEDDIIADNKITIKNGMAITNVTAQLSNSCTLSANFDLKMNVTSLNKAFISGNSIGAFKYVLASYDPNTYTNITTSALNGQSFTILKNESITNTGEISLIFEKLSSIKKGYMVILYIDGDLAMNDAQDSAFSATIKGTSTSTEKTYINLINHITKLYTSGNPTLITQETSNDTYYYSYQDTGKTWGLMNDGLTIDTTQDATTTGLAKVVTDTTALTSGSQGNIRYFGPSASVNNYIYFNCSDYNSQSSSTCELWRIIGVFDDKVKIIRNDSISKMLAWDQDKNQDSSLTTYSNNWETSSLQLFLNGLYYNRGTTESLTYYSGSSGSTSTTLNLKTIGITEATRANNLISEETWYLGGYSSSPGSYPNDIYNYERQNKVGTTIYGGNPFTINTNIGLMYVSDYGYGTDLTKCSKDIYNYNNSANSYACRTNNWLFNSANEWLLPPNSSNSYHAWYVLSSGLVSSSGGVYYDYRVRPVLYLNSELSIESGHAGTRTDPYRISVS